MENTKLYIPSKHFNPHRIIFSSPTFTRSLSSQKPDFKVEKVRNNKIVVDHDLGGLVLYTYLYEGPGLQWFG